MFDGRVALVTGSGSGIGRASAQAFAGEGARVAVVDREVEGGLATVAEIRDRGGEAEFVECDVTDDTSVGAMVARIVDTWGQLDFAHNNAGISPHTGNTVDCTKADWDAVLAVNLTGVCLCMHYEIPAMLANGGGAIVNTSSGVAFKTFPGQIAYLASKHGVVGITKGAALEFAERNVRVDAICPGTVLTPVVDDRLPFMELVFINTSASFITSLVPVPGGVGAAEAALVAGLTAFGIPVEIATATVVTHRLFTSYLPPIWGSQAMKWLVREGYL